MLGPTLSRPDHHVPEGLTLAEIIALAVPEATDELLERCRVVLVNAAGEMAVASRELWRRIRPKLGTSVLIRLVPGDSATLRNALLIAVTVGATALGQIWAPGLISALGLGGGALGLSGATLTSIAAVGIAAGIGIGGSLLVNALIPATTGANSEKPTYAISAWQNASNPDGVVPSILGTMRHAPPYAALPYVEVVGDDQYIVALFCVGWGPVDISDMRIGDTSIDNYDDVETEIRQGYLGDVPVLLYPQQVIATEQNAELTRPLQRDDAGNVVSGPSIETPVVRVSAADATEGCVILNWPAGLGQASGSDINSLGVDIRIRQRLDGSSTWLDQDTITFSAAKTQGFFRAYRWTFPSRGRWEIEVTRMTDERTDTAQTDRTVLVELQSFRPEAPIAAPYPMALVSARVKATYQLNGSLDQFNCLISRLLPDYDYTTGEWVVRATSNPAAHFRNVLQGAENPFPATDDLIGLANLEDWHDFCRTTPLTYNRIHDFEGSVWDQLTAIAAAGRASPTDLGGLWGVVIDRPQDIVVAHLNDRNARDISRTRTYTRLPDAFTIPFLDATSNYQSLERVVVRPGYVGTVTVTQQLDASGKTDPTEVWLEGARRHLELEYRPDLFTATQDSAARVATRGDLVKASISMLSQTQRAGRVIAVRDSAVELDATVTMATGTDYGLRFFQHTVVDDEDEFTSVLRQVLTVEGDTSLVVLRGSGVVPAVGQIAQFGELTTDSYDLIVSQVAAGQDMTSVLTAVAAAPEIDAILATLTPPFWDGRVGDDLGPSAAVPAAPVITSVESGTEGTGDVDGLRVLLRPGEGSPATVASFRIYSRLSGSGSFGAPIEVPAGSGGSDIAGYVYSDVVEIEATAVSIAGVESAPTSIVTVTIGAKDLIPPASFANYLPLF